MSYVHGRAAASEELGESPDTALAPQQALPQGGYPSQRALERLAVYQARAGAFGTVRFLTNLRRRLGRPPLAVTEVPGHLVREIGLPRFGR